MQQLIQKIIRKITPQQAAVLENIIGMRFEEAKAYAKRHGHIVRDTLDGSFSFANYLDVQWWRRITVRTELGVVTSIAYVG